jgi:hypothetical protein
MRLFARDVPSWLRAEKRLQYSIYVNLSSDCDSIHAASLRRCLSLAGRCGASLADHNDAT